MSSTVDSLPPRTNAQQARNDALPLGKKTSGDSLPRAGTVWRPGETSTRKLASAVLADLPLEPSKAQFELRFFQTDKSSGKSVRRDLPIVIGDGGVKTVSVSGKADVEVTVKNVKGQHVEAYINMTKLAEEHADSDAFTFTLHDVDTTTLFDGQNLLNFHAHQMAKGWEDFNPLGVAYDKVILETKNNHPSPSGKTKLPTLPDDVQANPKTLNPDVYRNQPASNPNLPTVFFPSAELGNNCLSTQQFEPKDRRCLDAHPDTKVLALAHANTAVLGWTRGHRRLFDYINHLQWVLPDNAMLLPFQREKPYRLPIAFFLLNQEGRANLVTREVDVPARAADAPRANELPVIRVTAINGQPISAYDRYTLPIGKPSTVEVTIKNPSGRPLGKGKLRARAWIGDVPTPSVEVPALKAGQSIKLTLPIDTVADDEANAYGRRTDPLAHDLEYQTMSRLMMRERERVGMGALASAFWADLVYTERPNSTAYGQGSQFQASLSSPFHQHVSEFRTGSPLTIPPREVVATTEEATKRIGEFKEFLAEYSKMSTQERRSYNAIFAQEKSWRRWLEEHATKPTDAKTSPSKRSQ